MRAQQLCLDGLYHSLEPTAGTRDKGKGDRVDATSTAAISPGRGLWTLRGADVHLEADRLLEDGGATTGLVFSPEAGLGQHTVTQAGDRQKGMDNVRFDAAERFVL